MQEMDIQLIFNLLLARIKWIIASIAVGVLLFASYAFFFIPDQYTASAKLYIRHYSKNGETTTVNASNLSAAEFLANAYAEVMKTEPVLNAAKAQLDQDISVSELKGMVSASLIKDSPLLQVSAKHGDPKTAQAVCNAMANALADNFAELTEETSTAAVVQTANTAGKTAPNVLRSALIGALIGLVISVAVVVLREFMDNTIRDKESLQIQVDVPVLGEIPSFTPTVKGAKRHA